MSILLRINPSHFLSFPTTITKQNSSNPFSHFIMSLQISGSLETSVNMESTAALPPICNSPRSCHANKVFKQGWEPLPLFYCDSCRCATIAGRSPDHPFGPVCRINWDEKKLECANNIALGRETSWTAAKRMGFDANARGHVRRAAPPP